MSSLVTLESALCYETLVWATVRNKHFCHDVGKYKNKWNIPSAIFSDNIMLLVT